MLPERLLLLATVGIYPRSRSSKSCDFYHQAYRTFVAQYKITLIKQSKIQSLKKMYQTGIMKKLN